MTRRDWAYILRERKRRADPACLDCDGEGTVTYTARNRDGEVEVPCKCLTRAGDFRDNYDGPDDDEAWSGGFAPNH